MKYIFMTALMLMTEVTTKAQDENSKNITGKNKGSSLFYGGVESSTTSYINTNTKDSNGIALYFSPYLDYNHKCGMGIRVKSYLLATGSNPGFYLTSISPYFAKYTGKLFPYISYTRYIQHKNPSVPYSPLQNELYAHLRYKTRFIDPSIGTDIGFGKDEQINDKTVSDFNAFIAVSHIYLKDRLGTKKNNTLAVRPGLQLNAGTDRYYKFLRTSGYLSKNAKANRIGYSRGRRNDNQSGGITNGATTYIIDEENNFGLSNIDVNIYLMYFAGKFSIEPSGSLYFPLRGEDKNPHGYWQINFNYWFN